MQPLHDVQAQERESRFHAHATRQPFPCVFGGCVVTWAPGLPEARDQAVAQRVYLIGADIEWERLARIASVLQGALDTVTPGHGERR